MGLLPWDDKTDFSPTFLSLKIWKSSKREPLFGPYLRSFLYVAVLVHLASAFLENVGGKNALNYSVKEAPGPLQASVLFQSQVLLKFQKGSGASTF